MKMYHSTKKEHVNSIVKNGLLRGGIKRKGFCVYLAPTLDSAFRQKGRVIFEVETGDLKLTAFDDCKEWEVLCWGDISPENVKIIEIIE